MTNNRKETAMNRKSIVFGIAVLALSLTAAVDPFGSRARTPQEGPPHVDTVTAVVLIDSLRVISYIDSTGVERPPDSTLIPPVPLSGVTEFRIVLPRKEALATK
jgi:hypothetical protein